MFKFDFIDLFLGHSSFVKFCLLEIVQQWHLHWSGKGFTKRETMCCSCRKYEGGVVKIRRSSQSEIWEKFSSLEQFWKLLFNFFSFLFQQRIELPFKPKMMNFDSFCISVVPNGNGWRLKGLLDSQRLSNQIREVTHFEITNFYVSHIKKQNLFKPKQTPLRVNLLYIK